MQTGGKWSKAEVLPYGDLSMSPRAAVLNYGQGIFEGMKAQRTADGRIVIFRPNMNARRVKYGCERLLMPPVPEDIFIDALKQFVLANAQWVPPKGQGTLYIRPIVFGSGPVLGLAPAKAFTFCIFGSPVGSYFKGNQLTPLKIKVEVDFTRAAPGGSGGIKAIGNYAPSLLTAKNAKGEGFDNMVYLDAAEQKYLEEIGTSNVFVVKGNTVMTPTCKGGGAPEDTILEGVTRDSIMQVCRDKGYNVVEKRISVDELFECDEFFTVGTAVVVSPIGEINYKGKIKKWDKVGKITQDVYDTLVGIQTGTHEDKHGWTVYVN